MCVENIFFETKKLQMKILLGKSQVALRKCKGSTRSLNAAQLSHEGEEEKLIHHDEEFCRFSSAETKWIHLLRILGQLVDNKYTNE